MTKIMPKEIKPSLQRYKAMSETFKFKEFAVEQDMCAMKVGTDGVLLGAWAEGGRNVLDIGCGTGVISLMLAQRFKDSQITAIDIVDDCCVQTRKNADLSPWGSRIGVRNVSLQDFVAQEDYNCLFDAVVSNPPFFVGSLKNPDKNRSLARHADSLPFKVLVKGVSKIITNEGIFSVIIPDECFKEFVAEAWFAGFYLLENVSVKTKANKPVKRHLIRFSKSISNASSESVVTLQEADGSKSEWYRKLTDSFYL